MTTQTTDLVAELKTFILTHHCLGQALDCEIIPVAGQASTRLYFRAQTRGASVIIMVLPKGFASPADEVTKLAADAPKEFPFLNVQHYLHALDLPVPNVLATEPVQGWIVLSDLGDTMLEQRVMNAPPETFIATYKQAIDLLVTMQTKTKSIPATCMARYRSFDADLLNWEFDHFWEYGICDRFQIKPPKDDHDRFIQATREITNYLATVPAGFVHRDYQSRNLMWHNNRLYIIDFQDALVGPAVYDLVALLRDSYILFAPDVRDQLIQYYISILPSGHPYFARPSELKNDFFAMALQRKLKDTGRFQFIKTVRHNDSFIKHVPQSLIYVSESLSALTKMPSSALKNHASTLRDVLSKYVPELA